jgi:hypothetical protein
MKTNLENIEQKILYLVMLNTLHLAFGLRSIALQKPDEYLRKIGNRSWTVE